MRISVFYCNILSVVDNSKIIYSVLLDKYPMGVYNIFIIHEKRNDRMEECCRCHKSKLRTEEEKKKLINRLSRIEGQIRGIKGMVERDAYCPDIMVQAAAVTAAVNSFNKELLGTHIRTCVANDIREGKDEVIDELLDTLQRLMK